MWITGRSRPRDLRDAADIARPDGVRPCFQNIGDFSVAAGRGDDDGVQALALDFGGPGLDIASRLCEDMMLLAEVMEERAAAAFAFWRHDFDAKTGKKPNRRFIDCGAQHFLRASAEKGDAKEPARPRDRS
jgi:hypothetical protein